jgi:predicted component of type VI protein secretion system
MRIGQRHFDELARLRVVINRQDTDDAKIWKPRGWSSVR